MSTITINARSHIRALIFLQDGRHLLSGSDDGRVRQWRVNDGVEVGGAMNTGDTSGMAVSRDGNWIVCGGGRVASVWNMKTRQGPVLTISDHSPNVNPVDISPDSSRFATGADDRRVFIWDIVTGKLLVGPLQHDDIVLGLRFSPDGDRIATGDRRSLRIYNAVNGDLLRTFQVPINSWPGNPILWSSAQSIFALSVNAFIHLGADEGRVFSNWTIPGALVHNFANFAMASNGRFIAAYVGNSISLWDPFTSARISSVITNPSEVWSIAISPDNKYLASSIAGGVITIRNLDSIIPAYYLVGQQPPGGGADLQALRDEFQALKSLYDVSRCRCTNPQPNRPQTQPTVTTPRIPDGTYRIKSNVGDLYLTRLQDGASAVVVQPLSQSNVSQRWTVSVANGTNGAYNITGNSNVSLTVGIRNALVTGRSGTTWNFDSRGNAYAIGNAVNVMTIQLAPNRQGVSVFPRNNSPNQLWVLESVTN